MKLTLLPIALLGWSLSVPLGVRAQETDPANPPPHPEAAPHPEEPRLDDARLEEEQADFAREMEHNMKGVMEKAAELEKEGKKEEAEEIRTQARKRMNAAIKEHRQAMLAKRREHQQRQRAQKIERSERERNLQRERQRAEHLDHSGHGPENAPAGPDHREGPPPREIQNRLHHVEQAIGHLREAGLPEPAGDLERMANRLRQALRPADGPRPEAPGHPRSEGPPPPEARPIHDDLAALRREIDELKKTVAELCKMSDHSDTKAPEKQEPADKHH